MSIFTKIPKPAEMMFGRPLSRFCISVLDNIKINKYAKSDINIQCGPRFMSIFSSPATKGWTDAQQTPVHQNKVALHASGK